MENFARFDDMTEEAIDSNNEANGENLGLEKFAVVMSISGLNSIVVSGSKFEVQDTYDMLKSLNLEADTKIYMLNVNQLNIDKCKDDSRELSKLLGELISEV